MALRMIGFLLLHVSLALARPSKVPPQFFYTDATALVHTTGSGCNLTRWQGTDPLGVAGYPHAVKIACGAGHKYQSRGVAVGGFFQIWLAEGQLTFNKETKNLTGSSFWASEGAFVDLGVTGTAWIVGDKFLLDPNAQPYVFTESYNSTPTRSYDLNDAKAGLNKAVLGHDEHIANGTSPSMDFVFGSQTGVDPPSVVVLNCVNSSSPAENFVWSHFHPFGAVYMSFSGQICFSTDETKCIKAGEARWTSPNLQYYEWFQKPTEGYEHADIVRELAGVDRNLCEKPILFAVTNFDSASIAGVPNFDDWPLESHHQTSCTGIGPWGLFDTMTVRSTTVVTRSVTVERSHRSETIVV